MALTVTAAYTVLGFSGFGAILVALPILAHLLSLRVAVPVLLVCDLFAASLMGLKNRHAVDRGELLRLAPFLLAGMTLGVVLLSRVSEAVLLTALGSFVLAMSLWNLYGRAGAGTVSATWALPACRPAGWHACGASSGCCWWPVAPACCGAALQAGYLDEEQARRCRFLPRYALRQRRQMRPPELHRAGIARGASHQHFASAPALAGRASRPRQAATPLAAAGRVQTLS